MAVDTPPYLMTEKHEEHVTDKDDADDSTSDSLVFNEINDESTLNMICSINEELLMICCEINATAPLTAWPLWPCRALIISRQREMKSMSQTLLRQKKVWCIRRQHRRYSELNKKRKVLQPVVLETWDDVADWPVKNCEICFTGEAGGDSFVRELQQLHRKVTSRAEHVLKQVGACNLWPMRQKWAFAWRWQMHIQSVIRPRTLFIGGEPPNGTDHITTSWTSWNNSCRNTKHNLHPACLTMTRMMRRPSWRRTTPSDMILSGTIFV